MNVLLLFGIFFILLFIGVPIGTSIGSASVIGLFIFNPLFTSMISYNFQAGIAKFPLIAIPFFVLAGVLMEKSQMAKRIADLARVLTGNATGGMAIAAIVTAIFWGAVSGSGPATTAAIGLILITPMVKQGYSVDFAASTVAAASGLAIIIPPSIAFILYGNVTGVSVGALFAGGIIPGVIIGLALIVMAYIVSKKRGYRGSDKKPTGKEKWEALKKAFWALLAPIIILGGIYLGIATPTEAAVIAVFYSLFIGIFVYRTLNFKRIYQALVSAVITSSVVMFVVTFAGIFSWVASVLGVIDTAAGFITNVADSAFVVLLLSGIVILIAGMFLDAISIIYVFMPILMPVLAVFDIDLLYFGVFFTIALAIGQITPPIAVNLYVAANLVKRDLEDLSKEVIVFLIAAIVGLIIIGLFQGLSLWLPQAVGLYGN
jgi:C4-dicarboxylate transporter DctM subunit